MQYMIFRSTDYHALEEALNSYYRQGWLTKHICTGQGPELFALLERDSSVNSKTSR